jgi:Protein of unknown function (DUF3987)
MTFHPGGATPAGNPFATGPEMDPEPLADEAPERPYPLAAPPEVMRAAVLEYRAYGQQPLRAEPAGAALSPSALEVWRASHDDVERELADGGEFEDVRDVAVKVADNAARIACLFHVFDLGPEGAVGAEAMRAGATVAAWHLFEAKRIFGLVKQGPVTEAAVALLRWMLGNKSSLFGPRDIQRGAPRALRCDGDLRRKATDLLVRKFWLIEDVVQGLDVYRLHPEAKRFGKKFGVI